VGDAAKEVIAAAGGALVTSTVTDCGELVPPDPVQVNVYTNCPAVFNVAVVKPAFEVFCAAAQPSPVEPPVPVQELAPVVVHASCVVPPVCRLLGEAVKEVMLAAGWGAAVTFRLTELGALLPPVPAHVKV
jgi:hypothetical protein